MVFSLKLGNLALSFRSAVEYGLPLWSDTPGIFLKGTSNAYKHTHRFPSSSKNKTKQKTKNKKQREIEVPKLHIIKL